MAARAGAGRAVSRVRAGAVKITRHSALRSRTWWSPPRSSPAAPRVRPGVPRRGSARAPRHRARSPPPRVGGPPRRSRSPARRARTIAVATCTPEYSSPTALARASAWRACLICASGSRASSGSDIGISKIHTASIVGVSIAASSVGSPETSSAAVCTMSSSSSVPTAAPGSSRSRARASAPRAASAARPSPAAEARFHRRGGRPRTAPGPTGDPCQPDVAGGLVHDQHGDQPAADSSAPKPAGSGSSPPLSAIDRGCGRGGRGRARSSAAGRPTGGRS